MASSEHVTILFTDLVGSTELSTQLDPQVADDLRRVHFSGLRRAIASSGGTEVKNLGDGVMVVFGTASAALDCAVAMQQGVDVGNRRSQHPLGLRVGLSGGEVTREGDDYFGDVVIEAARLCAKANGGQIVASELVRMAAGRRSLHRFHSIGDMELKGFPELIEGFEVEWLPVEVGAEPAEVSLPGRLETAPAIGIVAREVESAVLADGFKAVAAGEGRRVVLISGEPGIGKTTLAAQQARRAFEAGACVLFGHCEEDIGVPYGPFGEALRHFVVQGPEGVLRDHVYDHGGELARIVPALNKRFADVPAPTSSDLETERYLLFAAVGGLFAQVASLGPVVLVLDDLQWADKPSLQLLRHLVARPEPGRLLVLGTYRPADLYGGHALTESLVALRREPGVSVLELKGLDDVGVIAFMEAAAGHQLPEVGVELAHSLYRETDGNPFFVGEILRHLAETGAIYQDSDGRWTSSRDLDTAALPDSIREVVGSRVARLGDAARRTLPLAAVIGRDFDLDLLGKVADRGDEELLDILDAAEASALVRQVPGVPGRFTFAHALIQHTLYHDLGSTRRARAHRNVAEAIEALYGDDTATLVGALAYHWSQATQPVDATKAISYARRAGQRALEALAPDEAVRYFSQALELVYQQADSDPLLRVDILIELGSAQCRAGLPAFRDTLLDAAGRAEALGATEQLAAAALANSRGFLSSAGAIDAERVAVLEAALGALPQRDSLQRAQLLAMLCAEVTFGSSFDRRKALADAAKGMARRLGDPGTIVRVIRLVRIALLVPWLNDEMTRDCEQAWDAARQLGDPALLALAASGRYIQALRCGEFSLARDCFELWQDASGRVPLPGNVFSRHMAEATAALMVGEPDRAELLATDAFNYGIATGQPDALVYYSGQLAIARHQQGRLGELVTLVEQGMAQNPGMEIYEGLHCLAALEAGDYNRAEHLLNAAVKRGLESVRQEVNWLDTLLCYGEVAIELRAKDAASQLLQMLAPFSDQIPYVVVLIFPPVAFYLGSFAAVLGRGDEALAYFDTAADLNQRGQMKFAVARTALERGRMYAQQHRADDSRRARHELQQAADIAAANGYTKVEERARRELSNLMY